MKKLIKKYPRFSILILTFILAYIIFQLKDISKFHDFFSSLGYFGSFLSGILYVYGFTAAPATALLLIMAKQQNIFLSGLIAGIGALLGDLFIFKLIRTYFTGEIKKFSREKIFIRISKLIPRQYKKPIIIIFGFLFIASPFPDELGVTLLASSTNIKIRTFSILSYALNTIGIFIILLIGKWI